ncbi:hypothetical protein RHGRI_029871 [Rhododendron griersonianum]|uniref:ATP-dependent DNA helicase n=1 Tax=Rhododendron griersonianum TaxID=479676 RepID=A0AAV6IL09_9ERIC|nr:hypothetical protein RHGRI_029871 [Rhododendron griersonianum]
MSRKGKEKVIYPMRNENAQVQPLRDRNIGIVIHDERDQNVIHTHEDIPRKEAMARKGKATHVCSGKENSQVYSFPNHIHHDDLCSDDELNMHMELGVLTPNCGVNAEAGNVISKVALAQRARRERERILKQGTARLAQRLPGDCDRPAECLQAGNVTSKPTPTGQIHPEDICSDDELNMPTGLGVPAPIQIDVRRHYLGKMDIECPHCKALHWMDERLARSSRSSPFFGTCCLQGKVRLHKLIPPPPPLQALYDGIDERSKSFRANSREYNVAKAFTSLGAKFNPNVLNGRGPTSFIIHGELQHRTSSLLPQQGQDASYAQLYIYDPTSTLNTRTRRNPQLRRDVLQTIQECLLQVNPFVEKFIQAHALLTQLAETGQNLPAHLHYCASTDRRRYSLPTADEIAVVIPGDGTKASGMRDIILHLRGDNGLMQINECHPAYLPLHYALLFPRGEFGWEPNLRQWDVHNDRLANERLTQMEYYSYRSFERLTDLYQDLTDIGLDELNPNQIGQRFILPSSFPGGPRHMFEIFQDSMAITRYNHHPDIFLTMTANPNRPEITSALLPHQRAVDRPDLVARVFELKRKALMKEIETNKVFGDKVAHVYTIEFQKRGLPHMHALFFLKGPDKIRTCAQVDNLVCAEFPNPSDDPALFETVKCCMVHGSCSARNPKAVCMENGKCTKRYPRDFAESTTMDENSYPIYRRRHDNKVYIVRGHEVDNRDVVPHNPHLSRLFNCHINVEVCAGMRCVKYIHKYIYKGHDRATIVLGAANEIQQYLDARYIGPPEAAWRIFGHHLHEEVPTVTRLALHLPEMHRCVFNPTESLDDIRSRARQERSTLTGFFEWYTKNENAIPYTYQEFPQHFVWIKTTKKWKPRERGYAIGRMYFASPNSGERFYLRLLLTVVKGPKSYEHLRTVNNVVHDTFKSAYAARGLLEDDEEWVQCLEEAAVIKTGYQLRRLFSVILTQCSPQQPMELWKRFWVHICDDLGHKIRTLFSILNPTEAQIEDYGLFLLNQLLQESGKSLLDFPPMQQPNANSSEVTSNRFIIEHRQLQIQAQRIDSQPNIERLNNGQRTAYDAILTSVLDSKGTTFFMSGGAGTGKTFVYNTIAKKCRNFGHIVVTVALSGIASSLLEGGRTAHSTFCIPLDVHDNSVCGFNKQSLQAELFRETKLIIWDEVPMQHKHCVEVVDRTLQDICDNENFFGGITVVLGGDFRQILLVVPKGVREDIVNASLRCSALLEPNPKKWVQLPSDIRKCQDLNEMLSAVYPQLNVSSTSTPTFLTERIILSARNNYVNSINGAALNVYAGSVYTYLAADKMCEDDEIDGSITNRYPNEYLNSLDPPGLPPFKLELKVGSPIILLKNIAPKDGLCNGTRMMVVRCASRIIEVKILTGEKFGTSAFIPRISLSPLSSEFPFQMTRRQFPVRLAYAMTINKSQGQSVKFVGIDLRILVFSHGQLYVALSRCTLFDRISVLLPKDEMNTTTNIVYPEVLL